MRLSSVPRPTFARVIPAVLAVGAVALGMQVSPAGAASLLTVSSLTAPQGATVTVSGQVSPSANCPAAAPVQLTSTPATGTANLFPNGMGPQVQRDANGNFQATIVVPQSTPVGAYTIGVRCGTTTAATSEVLNVTAAATSKPSISVSPTSATPGAMITVTGVVPTSGTVFCPSGDQAQLTSKASLFPPDGFGPTVGRDAVGNFHTTYTIPSSTPPGAYTIGVRCGGGNLVVVANLQVTAPVATTTTTTTTTTTAPTTTTTSVPPTSNSLSPATTAPASTSTTAGALTRSTTSKSPVRWVALGLLALVILAGAIVFLAQRGKP